MFSFPLQSVCNAFGIIRRTEQDIIKMCIGVHAKCQFLSAIFMIIKTFRLFSKNNQISNFGKIRPVGAELIHNDSRTNRRTVGWTDARTDRNDEVKKALCNFSNSPSDNMSQCETNKYTL